MKQQMEESNKKLLQENLAVQQQEIQAIKEQLLHAPQPPIHQVSNDKTTMTARNLILTPRETTNAPSKHMPNQTNPMFLCINNVLLQIIMSQNSIPL